MEHFDTKFCKFCGSKIPFDAVVCTACGRQVEELKYAAQEPPHVVIHNNNQNFNTNTNQGFFFSGHLRSKWVALFLCFFFGYFGAHKFYEGKFSRGLLYLFTMGLFGIGVFFDLIALLFKPNLYVV